MFRNGIFAVGSVGTHLDVGIHLSGLQATRKLHKNVKHLIYTGVSQECCAKFAEDLHNSRAQCV